ncbi:hypothetical protein QFZ82_004288 [Streptomyces sp. V4I23]|uniref:peptidoglycan-binding protein n=1 Tax=Streptomyces sp. V4I23 TaxID=3042282 RepID=UPI002781FB4E|nr:peptidoglycan-binding protein [Streptomyces sp. V4I23]MDQ1009803.1 hypothetical protein [Streptomyces sp. V4I23]
MEHEGDGPEKEPAQVEALRRELVRIKKERNLSLDAFRYDTGYSRSSWNRVLKGEAFPPRAAMVRLCARLRLDTDRVMGLWQAAADAREAAAPAASTADAREAAAPAASAPGAPSAADAPVPDARPETDMPAAPGTDAAATVPDEADGQAPERDQAVGGTVEQPAGTAARDSGASEPVREQPVTTAPRPGTGAPAPEKRRRTLRVRPAWLVVSGLVVLLVIGRWYSLPTSTGDETPRGGQSQPPQARPTDPQPSASVPSTAAPREPSDKASAADAGRPPATASADPSVSASRATSPAPRVSGSPSSSVALGAAGRAHCSYNSDRTQTMAKGMVGSKVKQIQCLLNNNYDTALTVDGNFGTATDTAIRAVQKCSGITVDGQVGPQTWRHLDTPTPGCGH